MATRVQGRSSGKRAALQSGRGALSRSRTSGLPLAARRHLLVNQIAVGLRRCELPLDSGVNRDREIKLVIGVSGGADSLALLLGCHAIGRRKSADVRLVSIAVHVHHHLRPSADGDAAHVEQLCERFGIPLHVEHVYPVKLRGNVSANARSLRYAALTRIARDHGASFVATAHHAGDQLETMIAALCRGAGLEGLAGMPWRRPLEQGVNLIRPLLASQRVECESMCRAADIQWINDPTNVDPSKSRARLRRDVLPVLEELWPGAAARAAATADVLNFMQKALGERIDAAFGPPSQAQWDRRELAGLQAVVVAAGLRRAALNMQPAIADALKQRHLAQAADLICSTDRKPHTYDWPGGLRLKITSKSVSMAVIESHAEDAEETEHD